MDDFVTAKTLVFADYKKRFVYDEDRLYALLFERNQDLIGIRREKFAVRNLSSDYTPLPFEPCPGPIRKKRAQIDILA